MRGAFLLGFLVVGRGGTFLLPGPSGKLGLGGGLGAGLLWSRAGAANLGQAAKCTRRPSGLGGGVGAGFLWSRAGAACLGQPAKCTWRLSRSSVTWGRLSLISEYSGRLRT